MWYSFFTTVFSVNLVCKKELNLMLKVSKASSQGEVGLILSAAVSCSPDVYRLGGVKMGLGLSGKLGRAWVGAW